MKYMFTPAHKQFDYGFGQTADAFRAVAIESEKILNAGRTMQPVHLPIKYLYRHAIELYLKSIIIIIQKRLELPIESQKEFKFLLIMEKSKLISMEHCHDIGVLYDYFKQLIFQEKEKYTHFVKTDWTKIPNELEENIKLVRDVDINSTTFRYPKTKNATYDQKKSKMKSINPKKLTNRDKLGRDPMFLMLMQNDGGEIVDSYILDNSVDKELLEPLKIVTDNLMGACAGIRYEFADGG